MQLVFDDTEKPLPVDKIEDRNTDVTLENDCAGKNILEIFHVENFRNNHYAMHFLLAYLIMKYSKHFSIL